jgi:DUF1009 family protein
LAGNLNLPLRVARKLKASGRALAIVGLWGETAPELEALADYFTLLSLGELASVKAFFKECGAEELCLAGGISRESVLFNFKPDRDALDLLATLPSFQTDQLLRAVAAYLEKDGLRLVSALDIAPEISVRPGLLTPREPGEELLADLNLAFRVAKELGRLDVGQTAVVSEKITVALEGADGTDATISRGAALSSKPIAVAKVVKPTQDRRFDLPLVGPLTIELLLKVKAGGLILDSGGLILLDEEKCVEMAGAGGLVIVAASQSPYVPAAG